MAQNTSALLAFRPALTGVNLPQKACCELDHDPHAQIRIGCDSEVAARVLKQVACFKRYPLIRHP